MFRGPTQVSQAPGFCTKNLAVGPAMVRQDGTRALLKA